MKFITVWRNNKMLTVKNLSISTKPLILSALFFLISQFIACDSPDNLGVTLQPDNLLTETLVTDTFTVTATTVWLDSSLTAGTNRLLVGTTSNSFVGKMKATTYAGLAIDEYFKEFSTDAVYGDSIKMSIRLLETYGDPSEPITIHVYRLTEKVLSQAYYHFDSIAGVGAKIGEYTFTPNDPNIPSSRIISFNLDSAFGGEIFATKAAHTEDVFRDYFPGVMLTATTAKSMIVLDARNTFIMLFYNTNASQGLTKVIGLHNRFHRIQPDFSTGIIPNIATQKRIKSSDMNNQAIMQAGLPLAIHIEFPYLNVWNKNKRFYLHRAELNFGIVHDGVYDVNVPPAPVIIFNLADTIGRLGYNVNGSERYLSSAFSSSLAFGQFNSSGRSYSSPSIGNYVNAVSESPNSTTAYRPNYGLMMRTADGNGSSIAATSAHLTRIGVNNPNAEPLKLRVFYTEIK
jgi:hypothetical protein